MKPFFFDFFLNLLSLALSFFLCLFSAYYQRSDLRFFSSLCTKIFLASSFLSHTAFLSVSRSRYSPRLPYDIYLIRPFAFSQLATQQMFSPVAFYAFTILFFVFTRSSTASNLPETSVNRLHEPEADCSFSVHDKGPQGAQVSGTSLNSELYYRIKCKPETGYCLRVSNCMVSTDAPSQVPYSIIDEFGCTKEPSLFEHVEYEDDFTAGIYNPYPIRFRGDQKAAVRFTCATTLTPTGAGDACQRTVCNNINEFSRAANTPKRWR